MRVFPIRRALTATMALAVSLVPISTAVAPNAVSAVAVPCSLCGGGEFHPLTPTRVFDSRPSFSLNDVAPIGLKASGPTEPSFDVQLLDLAGGPEGLPTAASDVLAVVVSIAVTAPTRSGYLSAHASDVAPSTSAALTFRAGQTVSNLAFVRPGADGRVTLRLGSATAGTAHVVVDVFGFLSSSSYDAGTPFDENAPDGNQSDERGARLMLVNPTRLLDTRASQGGAGPIGPGQSRAVTIRGAAGVPDDVDVTGVVLNVAGVKPTATTFLALLGEAPTEVPGTANVNLVPGQTKSNLVMVPVGADGDVHVYNNLGSVEVVVDLMGYYLEGESEATRSGRVVPLSQAYRVLDTRSPSFGAVPLGPGQAETWSFSNFASSVNIGGVSVGNQNGFIGNLTNASLSRQYPTQSVEPSFLVVWPTGTARPTASNLNTVENGAVPNLAVVRYGGAQQVDVFNSRGYSHYVLDVSAVVLAN